MVSSTAPRLAAKCPLFSLAHCNRDSLISRASGLNLAAGNRRKSAGLLILLSKGVRGSLAIFCRDDTAPHYEFGDPGLQQESGRQMQDYNTIPRSEKNAHLFVFFIIISYLINFERFLGNNSRKILRLIQQTIGVQEWVSH